MSMNSILPPVYPITDCRLSKLSHLEQVEKLADAGARFIQLREKYAAPRDFYQAARAVMDFARPRDIKIIINDRADIALAVGADGVHLGQEDLPPACARRILGERAIIGFSTHSIEQATAAVKFDADYLAIGPVFNTKTKDNPDPVVGLEGLREVRRAIGDFPLVAIGGIQIKNAAQAYAAGADSLAVVGGILHPSENIQENYKRLQNLADERVK